MDSPRGMLNIFNVWEDNMDLIITKDHLNESNEYIGETDVANFDGNIIAEENLGCIKFKAISVSGGILS